jgi:hypothetical protein
MTGMIESDTPKAMSHKIGESALKSNILAIGPMFITAKFTMILATNVNQNNLL